jgi:hypothetical protein
VLVTDGRFAETKEWIAGLAIIECETREAAIEAGTEAQHGLPGQAQAAPDPLDGRAGRPPGDDAMSRELDILR